MSRLREIEFMHVAGHPDRHPPLGDRPRNQKGLIHLFTRGTYMTVDLCREHAPSVRRGWFLTSDG